MVGDDSLFVDVAPDGSKALFIAMAAGPVGSDLELDDDAELALFEYTFSGGAVRRVTGGASYAIYSPDGQHVLIGVQGDEDNLKLNVLAADLTSPKTVARDVPASFGSGFGADAKHYPTWVDDDTVLYITQKAVYGTAVMNADLMTVDIDGSNRTAHQARIDTAIDKLSD